MHFWELTARFSFPSGDDGAAWPRKIGLNWFIPAFVNSSVGSSTGTHGEDGTNVCPSVLEGLPWKNSMNVRRTWSAVGGGGVMGAPSIGFGARVPLRPAGVVWLLSTRAA